MTTLLTPSNSNRVLDGSARPDAETRAHAEPTACGGVLAGKVALITGAGSGLGAATARLFAAQGAKVGLFSRSPEEVDGLAAEIVSAGGEAVALPGDVREWDELAKGVGELRDRWGRLDVVFANAGVNGVWAPLEKLAIGEWNETMGINLGGTFLTVQAAVPLLQERGGSVIITSSVNGTRMFSNSGATAYACSKAAQLALSKMLAVEFARFGIRVNTICPGFIESAIHDKTERRDTEHLHRPVEFPEGPIP